ncbi:hypothetical protein J6590_049252, partial [Homalodisca vitripennis]
PSPLRYSCLLEMPLETRGMCPRPSLPAYLSQSGVGVGVVYGCQPQVVQGPRRRQTFLSVRCVNLSDIPFFHTSFGKVFGPHSLLPEDHFKRVKVFSLQRNVQIGNLRMKHKF